MAGNDINLILSDDDSDDQFIQVPIKKKDFGDFITSLLGQRETINGQKAGSFVIDHEWLLNLHHLIDQRIKLQAKSSLVDFSATISYHNAPDRTITTAKGFAHFNETRITTTESIVLTWTYLVIFPGKPSPEKQEISVRFVSDPSVLISRPGAILGRIPELTGGLASFTVAHTERTWGDDISALLIREIEACFKPETFLDKYHNTITSILGITCLMAGIFLPGYIEELIRQKEVAEFFLKALPNGNSFTSLSIDEKLNLALTILQPSNQLHTIGTGYKLLSMVCSMAISAVILFGFDTTKKSHILLTKKDSSEKECEEKKEKFKLAKRLISVASAIALGVAGNYAYYLLHLPS
ncbi:hypothetical protein HXW87_21680 [Pseudomonas sp. Y5-11]|jgi:hypothetical protein|uniref:hypothetical protein n=1 Tax=Pseudomonas sp. Y5-11 TaxID=2749808 RepID=UPI001EFB18A8|nr:hypothetical protein [Pseudomonas sp. Y5-11]ULN84676.1 hypothetical protein HXW87_21680 [Pseudomonas sp. Y5-11]